MKKFFHYLLQIKAIAKAVAFIISSIPFSLKLYKYMYILSHAKHIVRQLNVADFKSLISLGDAKNYLRLIPGNYDEVIIADLISAAISTAENFLCIKILQREYEQISYGVINNIIDLNVQPVTKISEVSKIDSSGNKIVLDVSEYTMNYHKNLLALHCESSFGFSVKYSVGYSSETLPRAIKIGVLMHMAEMYDKGASADALPKAAIGLYSSYRAVRI